MHAREKSCRVQVLRVVTVFSTFLLWHSSKAVLGDTMFSGLIAFIVIVLFGTFFCGWICPMGMLLEYSHNLTENKGRRMVYGTLWRNWRKYAVLLALIITVLLSRFAARRLFPSPETVHGAGVHSVIVGIFLADLTVLPVVLMLDWVALRFGRTWCNTLCPVGTIIGLFGVVNLVKLKVDPEICIDYEFNCLHCERVCPMRIPVTKADRWSMMDCNGCLKCWAECPVEAIKINIFDCQTTESMICQ